VAEEVFFGDGEEFARKARGDANRHGLLLETKVDRTQLLAFLEDPLLNGRLVEDADVREISMISTVPTPSGVRSTCTSKSEKPTCDPP